MNSRERVQRAIHFQGPDHIPHHLPDGKENDSSVAVAGPPGGPPYRGRRCPMGRQRKVDAWGVTWETMGGGSFGEAVDWPLADITRQADYQFPDLHNPDYFTEAREAVRANNASANPKYCPGSDARTLH